MGQLPFRENLEQFNNPEEVRRRLAAGNYNQAHARIAQEYLDSLGRKEASESDAKRDAREEETLALAKEANEIARSASFAATAAASAATEANDIARSTRCIAIAAAVIAAAAAIAQIIWR